MPTSLDNPPSTSVMSPDRSTAGVSTTVTTTQPRPSTTVDTGDVEGFEIRRIQIGERRLRVAVADAVELRRRGLMGVGDLGALDGMLFVMDGTVRNAFTMRNTLIPLQIAFFDEEGALVDLLEMAPCDEEPCPTYQPTGSYRYGVEVPLGDFDDLDETETLSIKA